MLVVLNKLKYLVENIFCHRPVYINLYSQIPPNPGVQENSPAEYFTIILVMGQGNNLYSIPYGERDQTFISSF